MDRDNDYDRDDGDNKDGSLSFREDGDTAENYMSLDEFYNGNVSIVHVGKNMKRK